MSASPTNRDHSPWEYRQRVCVAAIVAVTIHGGAFFTSGPAVFVAAQFGNEEATTVDVELVEQAPEEAPSEPITPEPDPVVPPEPESPVPEPVLEPKPDDIIQKEPEPKPEPKERPKPALPKQPTPVRPQSSRATQRAPNVAQGSQTGAPVGMEGVAKGGATSKATALYSPAPTYPSESRAAGEQGSVLLVAAVDATGRVTSVSLQRSSGFPRLDRAAQEAFRRYKLKPAMRNGQPIASTVEKSFRFNVR